MTLRRSLCTIPLPLYPLSHLSWHDFALTDFTRKRWIFALPTIVARPVVRLIIVLQVFGTWRGRVPHVLRSALCYRVIVGCLLDLVMSLCGLAFTPGFVFAEAAGVRFVFFGTHLCSNCVCDAEFERLCPMCSSCEGDDQSTMSLSVWKCRIRRRK